MRWGRWRTVGAVLASLGLATSLVASGGAASAQPTPEANVLAGSPFRTIVGATCLRSPLDRAAIPVCYTASANANFRVVLTRKEYESIGGVGWGGTTGLSAETSGCKGGALVTCRASVAVTRPELLMITPGRQRNPMSLTAMAYVYMDVATPPVPTEPLRVKPPSGFVVMVGERKTPTVAPESQWISNILLLHRSEHLPPFHLPDDFYRLSTAEQLFVLVDLERTTRGLVPYFGLSAPASGYLRAIVEGHGPRAPAGALDIAQAGASDPARAMYQWLYRDLSRPMPPCSRAAPGACPVAEDVVLQHHDGLAGMFDPLAVYVASPAQGGSGVRLAVGAAVRGATLSAPAAGPLVYTWAEAVAKGASPAR